MARSEAPLSCRFGHWPGVGSVPRWVRFCRSSCVVKGRWWQGTWAVDTWMAAMGSGGTPIALDLVVVVGRLDLWGEEVV